MKSHPGQVRIMEKLFLGKSNERYEIYDRGSLQSFVIGKELG